jgi:putative transposase
MQNLQPDICYHIFNHANGFENVFREAENYRYFLEKYRLYISPIAETYAWCLMPNHFHLIVRILKREEIEKLIYSRNSSNNLNFSKVSNFGKVSSSVGKVSSIDIEKFLSKQFANLFSCYTQSFNKSYKRMGSLFIKNFKREPILDKDHFLQAIIYVHRNPIHHHFCTNFEDWNFSSYFEIIHQRSELVNFDKVRKVFGGMSTFIGLHQQNIENYRLLNNPIPSDL